MARSLLWMTNNAKTDNTEVRIFDTSDQAKADITNVVWSYVGDFAPYMTDDGLLFLNAEWEFHYWDKATRADNFVLFQGWVGDKTPDELQADLNNAALPAAPFNTADMGTWTVVQETKWTGESSDERDVREVRVKFQFRITCDLDPVWYFENVLPTGGEGEDDDFARGAGILRINTGGGFAGTIDPLYDPDNFYIAELKTPDGEDANLIKIDSYRDFDYSTLRQSVGPVNLRVKEFAVYSNNPAQLLEPFIFDRKTAKGKQYQKVIAPIVSPYQAQRYVKTPDLKGYIVDGFTKLNYKILANTTVRIIMDYSEDMLPLKGVKNPTASKRIGFTDWKRNKSLNYSGDEDSADKDIPIKVQDKQDKQDKQEIELEALNPKWIEDMKTRPCGALKRIREKLQNKYDKLNPYHKIWREYLQRRLNYLEQIMDDKQCERQITDQITTIEGVAELYSEPYSETDYSPEVGGEGGLWLPTDNFSELRTMDDDAKRLLEDIDFPIDNT
tara:strand:+ start:168 stop:1667 length:1500 start_codon:yes stop_codon:yes gene_type:complete